MYLIEKLDDLEKENINLQIEKPEIKKTECELCGKNYKFVELFFGKKYCYRCQRLMGWLYYPN